MVGPQPKAYVAANTGRWDKEYRDTVLDELHQGGEIAVQRGPAKVGAGKPTTHIWLTRQGIETVARLIAEGRISGLPTSWEDRHAYT